MKSRDLLPIVLSIAVSATAASADTAPLDGQTSKWATTIPRGAVATAEKREGRWTFALAGQPFASADRRIDPKRVVFEIGSISKVFTGMLLAHAVVEGRLGLDDPLSKRLPVKFDGASATAGAVTLRQLATHTSCFPRLPSNMKPAADGDPYAQYDRAALFEYLATAKLASAPPCAADYSNLGFGILGVVLEIEYGRPWSTLVEEKITGPLRMPDTTESLSSDQQTRFAQPWSGSREERPWTFKAMAGAGALRSTLDDMTRFADALLAGTAGPLGKIWPLLSADHAPMPALGGSIGLGLIHTKANGIDTYVHEGGTGGFRSAVEVQPATGRAAIVLASNAASTPSRWLAVREASGHPAPARVEVTLPGAVLDEYAGVYPIDRSARFTVVRRGEGLVARLTGQPFVPLFATAKDEFFYKVVDAQLTFRRDAASGRVAGLTLHQNGRDVPAERSSDPAPRVEFPAAATLDELRGDYDFGQYQPGATISVRGAGEQLVVALTGQPPYPVFAVDPDRFEYDVVKAALAFERDASGKVVAVVLHQNGREMRAPRRR